MPTVYYDLPLIVMAVGDVVQLREPTIEAESLRAYRQATAGRA